MRGDRDELLRVAENLIENAIKYSAPEPGEPERTVWVEVGARDGFGVLSVRDEGPGIAPENIPRLTERFYRVDVGQSRAKGGTGLGLALVKHILKPAIAAGSASSRARGAARPSPPSRRFRSPERARRSASSKADLFLSANALESRCVPARVQRERSAAGARALSRKCHSAS